MMEASLIQNESLPLKPEAAWTQGSNIRTALRHYPQITRAFLIKELGLCLKMVGAGSTIEDDYELKETIRALTEEFPAMKLEEFKLIFQEIARGKHKLYNKLKLPEIMEVCRKWESRRSELLERLHVHNPETRGLEPGQELKWDPVKYKEESERRRKEKRRKALGFISLTEQDLIELGQIKPKEPCTQQQTDSLSPSSSSDSPKSESNTTSPKSSEFSQSSSAS